jgi:hypothetical protein
MLVNCETKAMSMPQGTAADDDHDWVGDAGCTRTFSFVVVNVFAA